MTPELIELIKAAEELLENDIAKPGCIVHGFFARLRKAMDSVTGAEINKLQPEWNGEEPRAWLYELATTAKAQGDGPFEYGGWTSHITFSRPNVPKGSIRNLMPLYPKVKKREAMPIERRTDKYDDREMYGHKD